MAAKWTADWVNRLFILNNGVTEIDVQVDLYSDWKEEVMLSDNMKYAPALRTVGGDPISDTQNLGATFFLINDWKIRPHEADHELVLTGNLFTDPSGDPVVVPTLGDYTVLVTNVVSNLVDSSVARLDLTQLLNAVYIDTANGEAGTEEGIGTPTRPVNNITDARIIATRDNLTQYNLKGTITLDQNYDGWTFVGQGGELGSTINLGGQSVNTSVFLSMDVSGTMSGRATFERVNLGSVIGFDGLSRECGVGGTLQFADNATVIMYDAFSEVPGTGTPVFDAGVNCQLNVRNYSGGFKLENFTSGCIGTIGIDPGHVIVDSSCDGGTLVVRGLGQLTDNSTGTVVVTDGLVTGADVSLTRKILANRLETDPSTGILTIYDDDGSVLVTAQMYEDVGGVQTYRAQGSQRRNKLT